MNIKSILITYATISFLTMASNVGATLIEYDLYALDDKLVTLDTDSGLEWLDLTETLNISHADILAGAGEFTSDLGFRFATISEVNTLLNNVGAVPSICSETSPEQDLCFPFIADLLNFLGCTQECDSTTPLARGMVDDIGSVIFWGIDTVLMTGFASGDTGFGGIALPNTGSFLVRSVVPEPSTNMLIFIGLITFIAARRRRV